MECEICKILIIPRRHYLQCLDCLKFFHRKDCLRKISCELYNIYKKDGWKCPTCQSSTTLLSSNSTFSTLPNSSQLFTDTDSSEVNFEDLEEKEEMSDDKKLLMSSKGLIFCHVN